MNESLCNALVKGIHSKDGEAAKAKWTKRFRGIIVGNILNGIVCIRITNVHHKFSNSRLVARKEGQLFQSLLFSSFGTKFCLPRTREKSDGSYVLL